MRYARIKDGTIETIVANLPENWENVSGLNRMPADKLVEIGWVPVIDETPALAPYESYGEPVVTIAADRVTRTYPVLPGNLEQAKADKRSELDRAYVTATAAGFVSSALGTPHTYPSTMEAQLDLVGSVVRGKPSPFACVDGGGVKAPRAHTYPQIQQVLEDGAAHKLALYTNLQTKLAAVDAATSVAEVVAVTW